MTQKFAWLHGAERVIAVDCIDYRLEQAAKFNKVETVTLNNIPIPENI